MFIRINVSGRIWRGFWFDDRFSDCTLGVVWTTDSRAVLVNPRQPSRCPCITVYICPRYRGSYMGKCNFFSVIYYRQTARLCLLARVICLCTIGIIIKVWIASFNDLSKTRYNLHCGLVFEHGPPFSNCRTPTYQHWGPCAMVNQPDVKHRSHNRCHTLSVPFEI